MDVSKMNGKKDTVQESIGGNTILKTMEQEISDNYFDKNKIEKSIVFEKKPINKFLFFIPIIIILIGIVIYFIVVPVIYGNIISFIDWLFTDQENIISTLRTPNAIFSKVNIIMALKIFWWIWLSCLITSLFLIGRQFQIKSKPNAANAILVGKEPYFMMKDVTDSLKQLKLRRNCQTIDSLVYSTKKLEEKFFVESDFGYGKRDVIECENKISKKIQVLLDNVSHIEDNDFEENIKEMNIIIININSLLQRRSELKRR